MVKRISYDELISDCYKDYTYDLVIYFYDEEIHSNDFTVDLKEDRDY